MQTLRQRWMKMLLLFVFIMAAAVPIVAQEGDQNIPQAVQLALTNLNQRLREDVTLDDLDSYEWTAKEFSDTSLGCPQPDMMYAQVITPGYEVLFTYDGTTYDYRVAEEGETVTLCDTVSTDPTTTPVATSMYDPQPCGTTYVVQDGDTLNSIADECETTVEALLETNPDIEDRSVIYRGQELEIPQSVGGIDLLPTPTSQNGRLVSLWPRVGPPGTEVELTATGYPPNADVEIGIGPLASEYEVIDNVETDANGEVKMQVTIPSGIRPGDRWVFVVVLDSFFTVSSVFHVTEEVVSVPTPTPTPEAALFERATIYLIALDDGGQSGEAVGCGDSLIPVEVAFEPTIAPLTAALETLLSIDTRMYGQSGLYNPLYNSDLTVAGIDIDDREAQINLSGELSIGGVCDNPRVKAQLTQIALQYNTIDSVSITINGQPLDEALSGR